MNIDQSGNTLTNGFWSGAPTLKGTDKEIWLAVRTDGVDGVGTAEDPIDGSGTKFDPAMSLLPENVTIHLIAGTYLTNGLQLKNGWKIVGAGMGSTIIQLASVSPTESGICAVVIQYSPPVSNVEIRDLTMDSNYPRPGGAFRHRYSLGCSHRRQQQ